MKTIDTLSILMALCATLTATAQFSIPNADFEQWEFNGWNYTPSGWTTGNTQLTQDTYQDSLPYSGELAMRVVPVPLGVGDEGEAWVQIPTQAIPASLDFWVKYERTITAYMGVTIEFYNEETLFYSDYWQATDTLADWTYVSLPLDQIEPVMTHAVIRVQALVGDLIAGSGWIAVDQMSVGGVVDGLGEHGLPRLRLYPNPVRDLLHIDLPDGLSSAATIRLTDLMGRAVYHAPARARLDLSALQAGHYILELTDAGALLSREEVVVSGR